MSVYTRGKEANIKKKQKGKNFDLETKRKTEEKLSWGDINIS